MSTDIQIQQLTDRQTGLEETLQNQNNRLQRDIQELRQALNVQLPHSDSEDNMDIMINTHNLPTRDINAEQRPQMSAAGLSVNNKHFRDLSNHELHQIKKIHDQDHKIKPQTILDESLGEIMDKCINFLTYSFDGYSKKYYEA